MMETESQPSSNSSPVPTIQSLTLRLLMLGKVADQSVCITKSITNPATVLSKEVGSIIGKEGRNVKRIREESGARINISDGSSPERIVTLVGTIETISSAFKMICTKFLEDIDFNGQANFQPNGAWTTPLTIRLLVPACQCGCLIGKGGSKIKELRNMTGASVQVASDALPNSTERAITLTGNFEPITRCFELVCQMLAESPPKGPIIPYRPKALAVAGSMVASGFLTGNPVGSVGAPQGILISGGPQTPFILQSQFPLSPAAQADLNKLAQMQQTLNGANNQAALMNASHAAALQVLTGAPMLNGGAVLRNVNGVPPPPPGGHPGVPQQTHEITIPNDWVGCVIGRGGVKINEIRHLSGAVIKISPCEDGKKERSISITGSPEAVNVALYLIQTRISAELLANGGFCL